MAYSKQNFQDGQILNAANLEKMENGIIAGQGAENLLDNSDFRNPVNSRGKNTYSDDGNEYTIDRWKTQYGTNISIENGYINIFGNWDLYQHIQNPKDGIYTFAARIRVNSVGQHTPVIYVNDNNGSGNELLLDANIGEWKTYILQHDFSSTTGETITFALSPRGGNTTASISAEWAAMYKGAYTADTLPPYVPKGKHIEMLNCGIPLAPHNLLDNSDFTNPVNQRGATTATLGKYFIDRWNTEPFPSGPSITIDSNGLTLLPTTGSTAGIFQEIPDYEKRKGKIHTFAICVGNEWKCISFTMGNFGVGYQIHGLYFFSTDNRNILIRNNASDNPAPITIQHVALYEGFYTADTLPPYVPKGKHVEMLNCGIPLTPHNLLDNSDFRTPVNQRGQTSYSSQWAYSIDRWYLPGSTVPVTVGEGYVSFNAADQFIGKAITNGYYTLAVKLLDGRIFVGSAYYTAGASSTMLANNGVVDGYLMGDAASGNHPRLRIQTVSGEALSFVWTALYEGAYDASTLPAYQPKGYAVELAECRRYYVHCGEANWMTGFFKVGEGLVVEIPAANNIRATYPTIIVNSPKVFTMNGWYNITYSSCSVTKCWTKLLFNPPEEANQYLTNGGAHIIAGIVGISADL